MSKFFRAFVGALVTGIADVLINLIAAGIQSRPLIDQLISAQGIWILVVLALICLLAGVLLGSSDRSSSSQPTASQNPISTILSDSKLFWSTTTLKGKGIHMNNVTSVGSKNEVDTSD